MKKNFQTKNVVEVMALTRVPLVQPKEVQLRLRRWTFPTRVQLWQWLPFLAVVVLGAILRFWGLGMKPLHHDESLHAYFSLLLMHNLENWQSCIDIKNSCYHYDPLLHGPFQFHIIALVYKISQWLGAPDHGVNTTTLRIAAATLGTAMVGLPYYLRDYLGGRRTAVMASFLLAVSPCLVYYSRFAREDIYMAFFTFLLVVAAGRYVRNRKGQWLVIGTGAFVLSYATKEATFLSSAVFGSFLVGLIAWEIGSRMPVRARLRTDAAVRYYVPQTAASLGIVCLLIMVVPLAKWFFGWMKDAAAYINTNTATTDALVTHLKDQTVAWLPWIVAGLLLCALACWGFDRFRKRPADQRFGLAARVNPRTQPVLDTFVTLPWTHWLVALLVGVFIFTLLFSVVFTNLSSGIGDGIWQGLYYWLQQQQVARGGQPWYYYLILIPLYEQIGLVFGIVGVIRCLFLPTRFRLFLVYWCVGTIGIYSWAGEKMPWLTIHMMMPMLLLAAIGLEPLFARLTMIAKNGQFRRKSVRNKVQLQRSNGSTGFALFSGGIALLLLILTVQNMLQVTFVHYADGPHEMLIYVQSTLDVHTVMDKIDQVDLQQYQGDHKATIGVMSEASWPFYWYLRDYTNVCYGFPTGCANANPDVIISAGESLDKSRLQYARQNTGKSSDYSFHQYHLRSWWDEGYKPRACVPSATDSCQGKSSWGGVGLLPWLSYGDTPPDGAQFNPGLVIKNVWDWWWLRKSFGSTTGATDMGLFIRSDLRVNP